MSLHLEKDVYTDLVGFILIFYVHFNIEEN